MIEICFNLDENYLKPCQVLINNIDQLTKEEITYHFIGLSEKKIKTKNKCKFYPKPDLSFFKSEHLGNYCYFTQAAMYRLLIPFLIESERALYLDIDTTIFKDIKLLWDKKIDLAGAVKDPNEIFRKEELKFENKNYFNSGVILFNSKKIREEMPDYKELILKAQEDYKLVLKDQDIFNIVFKGRITVLGYEFNMDAHNLQEPKESKETKKLKDKAYKNPIIVHCMGKEKWWTCQNLPFGENWDKYAGEDLPKYRKYTYRIGNLVVVRS